MPSPRVAAAAAALVRALEESDDSVSRIGDSVGTSSPSSEASWWDTPLLSFDTADGKAWTPFSVRFRGKTLLRVATAFVLAVQIALTVVLIVNEAYNMKMFTLWSFTLLTAFNVVLLVALYVEHWLLTYSVLFGLPVILGNVVFVAVAIVVIIANDSTVYAHGTPCETPPPANPEHTVSQLHTGDWAEHAWPVFAVVLILLAGGEFLATYMVVRSLRSFGPVAQWLYWIYWMCASLAILVVYQLIFDIGKIYPTSFTVAERTLILLAIIWVWQAVTWWIFTAAYTLEDVRMYWLPTLRELAEGKLSGAGASSSSQHEVLVPDIEQVRELAL